MRTKAVLGVTETLFLLEAARAHAQAEKWNVSIAVVDDGGHLLGLLRLDGAPPVGAAMATEKARTSAMGCRDSGVYESSINNGRTAFLSAPLAGMLEGAVPIIVDAQVIGAVGVSGAKSDQDAEVARTAIEQLLATLPR